MLTDKLLPDVREDLLKLKSGIEPLRSFMFRWNALATPLQPTLGLGLFPEEFCNIREAEIDALLDVAAQAERRAA